jgi:uncharacterized protein YjiS (DUF1127 family)
MSTLTATQILSSYAEIGVRDRARIAGLRALFGRMATASRFASSRRALSSMNEHMLRDLGLTRGDLDAL